MSLVSGSQTTCQCGDDATIAGNSCVCPQGKTYDIPSKTCKEDTAVTTASGGGTTGQASGGTTNQASGGTTSAA